MLRPDPSWRRLDATTLLAGSPLTLFRVTAAGAQVLDAIAAGEALPPGHAGLTQRLLAAGAIHPHPSANWRRARDVTVVVPAYRERSSAIAELLDAIGEVSSVVVVDDATPEPIQAPADVTLIRLPVNRGPAAARNAALPSITTPYVLFVDADAILTADHLGLLLGHLDDERVAAVAPRVAPPSLPASPSLLARYEATRSPLDMGDSPALVRRGSRIGYVPSAVLLCRVEAVRDIGGFDPDLRFGEDVDLIWRLTAAGWACRYEPDAVAHHAIRASMRPWLRQRYHYGTAAARLARRHPGALAPARVNRWSLAAWTAVVFGHPFVGLALGGASTAALARKLAGQGKPPLWRAAWGIAGRGNLYAGAQLADATTSVWAPLTVGAAIVSRRARRVVAVALVLPAIVEWARTHPPLDPLRFGVLRALDRAAYGLGVCAGAGAERDAGPLVPDIT